MTCPSLGTWGSAGRGLSHFGPVVLFSTLWYLAGTRVMRVPLSDSYRVMASPWWPLSGTGCSQEQHGDSFPVVAFIHTQSPENTRL